MKKTSIMLNSKFLIISIVVSGLVLVASTSIFAQGGGGPIPPHVLPLTGGIGALIAAGIAAGIFINKKFRKKQ